MRDPTPEELAERKRAGIRLALLVLLVSVVMGAGVYWKLVSSERDLSQSWIRINQEGRDLSVTGCLEAVLSWYEHCEALEVLCDNSASGMMLACLDGQDRTPYCREVGARSHDARFGYDECLARDLDRGGRAACAFSFRAIDFHCQRVARNEAL